MIQVIYGPRRSGKSTKLMELAKLDTGYKVIIGMNNQATGILRQIDITLSNHITTIFLFRPRSLRYSEQYHLYIDEMEYMSEELVTPILQTPWRGLTITGGIRV